MLCAAQISALGRLSSEAAPLRVVPTLLARPRYGNAHDWIVSDMHMRRTGGIKSWGRGGSSPNYCPNIRIQIVDCVIEEANHIANWAISGNWTNKTEHESPPGAGMPKMQFGNGSTVEHTCLIPSDQARSCTTWTSR